MKIRTDYVTNSSSSSFILGFKNEEEIESVIKEGLPSYWSESVIQDVISDIKEGITSKEDAIDMYTENLDYWGWRFKGKSYWDLTREEKMSPEWCDFKKSMIDSKVAQFTKELNEYDVVSIVEYEDNSSLGSDLEHHIMPYLYNTITHISHH